MAKLKIVLLIVIITSFLFLNCSEDSNLPSNFLDQTLQGKIGGSSWEFKAGYVYDSLDNLFFKLYNVYPVGDPSSHSSYVGGNNYILFSIVSNVGIYNLSYSQTVTLYADGPNNIATEGKIEIIEITSSNITGRLVANFDNDNFANGNFSVTNCIN